MSVMITNIVIVKEQIHLNGFVYTTFTKLHCKLILVLTLADCTLNIMQNASVPDSGFMSLLTSVQINEFHTQMSASSSQLWYIRLISFVLIN